MNPFQFETAPRIVCQPGAVAQLGTFARNLGISHVLLVTDAGLQQAGLTQAAVASLAAASVAVSIFSDVRADPPEACILQAVAVGQSATVDGVIGFGGGSSLDTAKLVALLLRTPQLLQDIYGAGLARGPRLPLIQVPTTAGTGSEVTWVSVVTTPGHEKKTVVSSLLLPDLALLDSQLTTGLPPAITAMTGIDAMVHAIEALTTVLKRNPISDVLALKALQILYSNLPAAVGDGHDLVAREQMLFGSLLAGMAFGNSSVGAVHALAYPLGGHFHIPHGLSNSLLLPHVLRFNLESAQTIYAEMGRAILPGLLATDDGHAAAAFVQAISQRVARMPYAQTLRQAGIPRSELPLLASEAMKVQRLLDHNPRPIGYEDALAIYQAAF